MYVFNFLNTFLYMSLGQNGQAFFFVWRGEPRKFIDEGLFCIKEMYKHVIMINVIKCYKGEIAKAKK